MSGKKKKRKSLKKPEPEQAIPSTLPPSGGVAQNALEGQKLAEKLASEKHFFLGNSVRGALHTFLMEQPMNQVRALVQILESLPEVPGPAVQFLQKG